MTIKITRKVIIKSLVIAALLVALFFAGRWLFQKVRYYVIAVPTMDFYLTKSQEAGHILSQQEFAEAVEIRKAEGNK